MKYLLVILLLSIFFIVTLTSSLSESPIQDEGHIITGFLYLRYGNLTFNSGSPLLADAISASPLLLISKSIVIPQKQEYFQIGYVHTFVRDFFMTNKRNIDLILLLARLPVMLAGVLLGLIIFLWAKQWYGYMAGIIALSLYVIEPNMLAHSHYVTTDIFFALFFVATLFFLQQYILKKQKIYQILFIIFFVASQLTKITAIFLFPVCFFIFYFYSDKHMIIDKIKESFIKIFILGIISIIGINTFYGWRDVGLPLAYYLKQDNSVRGSGYSLRQIESSLPFHGTKLGRVSEYIYNTVPLPITYQYTKTLGWVYFRSKIPHQAFLVGYYFDEGWKLYFPIVTLLKMPISLLLFLCFSVFLFFAKKRKLLKKELVFILLPLALFALPFITSRVNTGYRLMLFLVPLVIIFSADITKNFRKYLYFFFLVIIFQVYLSFSSFPNFMGYANFIDNKEKYKYITDSNIDWGQDIKRLALYIKENNIISIKQNLYGILTTELYNVQYDSFGPPWFREKKEAEDCEAKGAGLYAVSASQLNGTSLENHNCFDWLIKKGKLEEVIGSSIYIFRI